MYSKLLDKQDICEHFAGYIPPAASLSSSQSNFIMYISLIFIGCVFIISSIILMFNYYKSKNKKLIIGGIVLFIIGVVMIVFGSIYVNENPQVETKTSSSNSSSVLPAATTSKVSPGSIPASGNQNVYL